MSYESSRCRHPSFSLLEDGSDTKVMDENFDINCYDSKKGIESSEVQCDHPMSEHEREILHSYISMHTEDGKSSQRLLQSSLNLLALSKNNDTKIIRVKKASQSLFWRQCSVLSSWFLLSFLTIVSNKYILSTLGGDIGILAESQLLMTTVFGCIKMYFPCYFAKWERRDHVSHTRFSFLKSVSILGWLRFGSVVCSVVSLKYMAVSFSETIKSSAPLFTVIIAYIILGEYSGLYSSLSLVPIMVGLSMCFLGEITFNTTGFIAAICNNILDCIQNVFSKKLLSGDDRYNPLELQFYTSVAASVVQLPFWMLFMDFRERAQTVDQFMMAMILINGLFFYLQSVTAYLLMSLISPVTFSVSSTVKRAALIWFSVIVFGNQVTLTSALGTALVVIGVGLYQRARHMESPLREKKKKEVKGDRPQLPV